MGTTLGLFNCRSFVLEIGLGRGVRNVNDRREAERVGGHDHDAMSL